jgi:hypothetical protein
MATLNIGWEEGRALISTAIQKLRNKVEGTLNHEFCAEDYTNVYTIIYQMTSKSPAQDYAQQLYDMYKKSLEEYIDLIVLPKQRGEFILKEFERRWENYNVMVRYLSNMFYYLDRYFVQGKSGVVFPTLREAGLICFH